MDSRSVLPYYQSLGGALKYTAVMGDRRNGQKDVSNNTFTAALAGVFHVRYRPGFSGVLSFPQSRTDATGPQHYCWLVSQD